MTISSFLTPLSNAAQPCLPPISSLFGSASARPVFSGREAALQAELLLSLNPESLTPATINALENRPIHQLPSGLPGENDEKELSREERNQIWVTEPTVTYDVFRKINRVVVRKNEKEWNLGLHIDDAIVRNTPKAFIADGENTEFYDEEGNFICGIVYNVDVKEGAIDELGPLAQATTKRGAAAGLLTDIEKQKQDIEFKGATNIKVVGEGWALSYKGEGNKRKTTKANSHYSTTYGVSGGRGGTTVDGVAPTKRAGLNVLKPYFQNLTDCFKKSFPAQYQAHDKAMSACHGNSFYQEHSVFSAMVVNRHEIDGNGLEKKRSRAAIHIDKGHHKDTFELMLTLKQNIAGGDLYLPEYGILLKLQDRSVTCFNATVQKHAVTAIGRENLSKQANRVTAVAYMTKLSDGMLLTAKDHANSRAASARASVPRAVPGQAGHLGYMPLI